uniref:Uncharacterized protein n=1 Tax=Pseudo-nitzschia australis TaxID=44445 RepID=A0A7S4AGJ0_9STRA|mmetsp:Transcript_19411/g.42190  ORF Transcript_19411/g.42190 Transcript_19411/m.42190 type:complete len:252 (+) Transcript_19411:482-1237(+)|eukprot:CAMPEP_0168266746 /NCGR_PEP_ID=MMETSP0141_2-20121125/12683_1 /TAXON_ID=44445 /ORGANISM="Pseudo-nitzschia australis, Strain 10249 10 AB" /LENGTH=251 /DNA_ID=CAMNT_0008206795 /DNA_START=238 /DNA_END=993 /DNA_ORIENTATION=+
MAATTRFLATCIAFVLLSVVAFAKPGFQNTTTGTKRSAQHDHEHEHERPASGTRAHGSARSTCPTVQATAGSACDFSTRGSLDCAYNYVLQGCPGAPDQSESKATLQCLPLVWCKCENEAPDQDQDQRGARWACKSMGKEEYCPGGPEETPPDRHRSCTPNAGDDTSPNTATTCQTITKRKKCKERAGCSWKRRGKACKVAAPHQQQQQPPSPSNKECSEFSNRKRKCINKGCEWNRNKKPLCIARGDMMD